MDLLFLLDGRLAEKDVKDAIRRVNQEMWDSGIRVSPATRKLAECERFDEENAEFAVSLMDHRLITGDAALYRKLAEQTMPKLLQREQKAIDGAADGADAGAPCEVWGHALSSGAEHQGLSRWAARYPCVRVDDVAARDVGPENGSRVSRNWESAEEDSEFRKAVEFLWLVRCFLHYRHERDDNTLDWQAQDAAAAAGIGWDWRGDAPASADAAYWMRFYFRHARRIERRVTQMMEEAPLDKPRLKLLGLRRERQDEPLQQGFRVERGRIVFDALARWEWRFGARSGAGPGRRAEGI